MAIFSGFNNLAGAINSAFNNTAVAGTIRNVADTLTRTANIAGVAASFINNPVKTVKNLLDFNNDGKLNLKDLGTAIRMSGNALQGVGFGAAPQRQTITIPRVVNDDDIRSEAESEWRVRLEVPKIIAVGDVLEPLIIKTNSHMVFPFNPVILFGQSANYSQITPTHSNFPFHAYRNSQVDNITITGEYYVENADDAKYWIATIHFLRTMTKMFYGQSEPLGNPPLMTRLKGYGSHVLNNIPVLITNFTVDLPADVDYIPCVVGGTTNYVPTQSQITVTCAPNYARSAVARFSLNDYAAGNLTNKPGGFM